MVDYQLRIEDIIALDLELNIRHKGFLVVKLNLQQGIIVWRESHQWCNNFVRTLTDEQLQELKTLVRTSGLLARISAAAGQNPDLDQSDADQQGALRLTAVLPDRQISLAETELDQKSWHLLRQEIEKLSHVPFQLS